MSYNVTVCYAVTVAAMTGSEDSASTDSGVERKIDNLKTAEDWLFAAGFVSGHTLVVDGAAWMWRKPMLPRAAVLASSRGVEKQSRGVGIAGGSGGKCKL